VLSPYQKGEQQQLVMTTNGSYKVAVRRAVWVALIIISLTAMAIVVAPVWIIQPFKAQTGRGLAVSHLLRRWSPFATVASLVVSFVLVGWLWMNSHRWYAKAALLAILLPMLVAAWFARQNHFEWMFNPLVHTAYAKSEDAVFLNDTDMVLAVEKNGEAVAYPVRLLGYHHVVQDVVGGTPIVATY
jgi:uncharacterized protein DUF3179